MRKRFVPFLLRSTISRRSAPVLLAAALVLSAGLNAWAGEAQDWLTWGGDPERTGWNRNESRLSKKNVGKLELKWKAQVENQVPQAIESGAAMLTAPLILSGVRTASGTKNLLFTFTNANMLAALDTKDGKIVWQRKFEGNVPPSREANWVCTNSVTATPVIDKQKGILYTLSTNGTLHGVSVVDGSDKMSAIEFVPPYSRNWSLNLVDGVIYTTVGRGCGNPPPSRESSNPTPPGNASGPQAFLRPAAMQEGPARSGRGGRGPAAPQVASHMAALDLNAPDHPIARFYTSPSRPSGAWTRAGMAWAQNSFLVETADGAWDPATGKWGQTLLRLAPRTLKLLDYFTPPNLEELNKLDLDYGSGGTIEFPFGNRRLVFSSGKDGTVYLHDAASLGGADHRTPLFSLKAGNDALMYASNGVWGAPATAVDSRNQRWIYVPMWGPPSKGVTFAQSHGEATEGSIMAFQVETENGSPVLRPAWVSRNLAVPEPPVVANGVVYALSTGENTIQRHTDPRYAKLYLKPGEEPPMGVMTAQERAQFTTHAILYALDAETGQELYSSKDVIDDWTHLSSVVVADGQVYVTTRKSIVYAFGLKK